MVDCMVIFNAGKHRVMECLQKSWLHDVEPYRFESNNRVEIKEHIKKILITNIKHENNLMNYDDIMVFLGIITHIQHLDATDNPTQLYCEVAGM